MANAPPPSSVRRTIDHIYLAPSNPPPPVVRGPPGSKSAATSMALQRPAPAKPDDLASTPMWKPAAVPIAKTQPAPAAATSGSVRHVDLLSPVGASAHVVPTPVPAIRTRSPWSEQDEVVILESLRSHRWHHDALPRGVDLITIFFGRLSRTDYSLAEIETKIRCLRRRFTDTDAMLCAGTGGPAAGHDLRLYTLSLEVWGATATKIAAPRRDLEPAKNAPGKKYTIPPASRPVVAPTKRRRYDEMREQYPRLVGEVEKLARKALEGIDDLTAWSLEMRVKNQRLPGGMPAAAGPAEDRTKELTSLITSLF